MLWNTSRRSLSALLALMLLGLTLALPVNANDQYALFIFQEDKEYQVGDTAMLEIHLFDRHNYVDASEVNLSINDPEWNDDGRYLEVDEAATRKATGIYEVTLTILDTDVSAWGPWSVVEIEVTCVIDGGGRAGGQRMSEGVMLSLIETTGAPDFAIDIEVDEHRPLAGDILTFSATFTNHTAKVDPASDDIIVALTAFDEAQVIGNLTMLTKQSTGVYTYAYTIPTNRTTGGRILMEIDGEYDGANEYVGVEATLRFYEVWVHHTQFTASSFKGALYVSDLSGKKAEGVVVDVAYEYDTGGARGTAHGNLTGTTDADGKVTLDLTLQDFARTEIDLEVFLNGTYTDNAAGDVGFPGGDDTYVPKEPYGWGLEVIPQNKDEVSPDTQESLTFKAYYEGDPLNGTDLSVYVVDLGYHVGSTYQPVLAHAGVTTDAGGGFDLSFRTPGGCEELKFIFKTNHTTYGWVSEWDYFWCSTEPELDGSVKVSAPGFGMGKAFPVTVSKSGVGEETGAFLIFGPVGDREDFDMQDADDIGSSWTRLGTDWWTMMEDGSTTFDVILPEFLPADENYLLMGAVWDEGVIGYSYQVYDSSGKVVASPADDGDDDGGLIPGFGLLLMMAVLACVAVAGRRRRSD